MAIFLIKDRDATHPDPVKDLRGCFKRGDIVEVFEDDKPLVLPPAPPFVIVKITGPTKAQAEKYLQSELVEEITPIGFRWRTVRRRLYHLSWADLPLTVRNQLVNNRYYETTWDAVRTYIKNKVTGVSE